MAAVENDAQAGNLVQAQFRVGVMEGVENDGVHGW